MLKYSEEAVLKLPTEPQHSQLAPAAFPGFWPTRVLVKYLWQPSYIGKPTLNLFQRGKVIRIIEFDRKWRVFDSGSFAGNRLLRLYHPSGTGGDISPFGLVTWFSHDSVGIFGKVRFYVRRASDASGYLASVRSLMKPPNPKSSEKSAEDLKKKISFMDYYSHPVTK